MTNKIKARDHESYIVYTVIAFLIPLAGIIMGAVMLTKDEKIDKKLGEHAIVSSIFGIIIYTILLGTLLYYMSSEPVDTTIYYGL